ncbi:MAG TPA: hypothetical protein VN229_13800 [Terriglobales bacterium]|nr:hypothetical protein [Terriglobales bacterium]
MRLFNHRQIDRQVSCRRHRLGRTSNALIPLNVLAPLAAALLLALPGCEITTAGAVYSLVEGSSLNQTGKTASDHIVSSITGEDCNILRYQKTGRYCLSSAELAQMAAAEQRDNFGYCYRHLAQVVCYTEPDTAASGETRVH